MFRLYRRAATGAAALMIFALPLTARAQEHSASTACPAPRTHSLPKGASGSTTIITFGVQGGTLRPWSVKIALDGSISADGTTVAGQRLTDPFNALKGLLALADAKGFFTLKKTVGCLGSAGNPDTSSRFIAITAGSGTKKVQEFGSCKATAGFDQLTAVFKAIAGMN